MAHNAHSRQPISAAAGQKADEIRLSLPTLPVVACAGMRTVKAHRHSFPDSEWPFSDPQNAAAFSTTKVFQENFPILLASHDVNGDWQFLCNTTLDPKNMFVACLGCAFERDKTIAELADLPRGWLATREHVGGPWIREELTDAEKEA